MNTPVFQQLQRQFLTHLRQPLPDNQPPGFAPERLAVYVDLLYNKFDESLNACFPVLHSILEPSVWRRLLQDFIAEHQCQSPYYRQIPDEFVLYLQNERNNTKDLPFLAELAHFEWVELQLSIREAEPFDIKSLSEADLLAGEPMFTPVRQLLHYHWPVQDISPKFLPTEQPATPTHILGFRDIDDQVQFIALSPATARLVMLLESGLTGQQALQEISAGLDSAQRSALTEFGLEILAGMHQQGVIINIRPSFLWSPLYE